MANQGSTEKSHLRRSAKLLLQRISPEQRRAWSERICAVIVERFPSAAIVATYAPTGIEPDLDVLWGLGYFRDRIALYPRVSGLALVWCEVQHLNQLRLGDFGLRQPDGDGSKRIPDLVLVPGLWFSRDCHRLGRGSGHYDRFLGLAGGAYQKIGVCFRMQLVAELPAEDHDVRLDDVVTD
jgi:5-formyltetrahydrofolate cyclo-ligase